MVVLVAIPLILLFIGFLLSQEFARTRALRDAVDRSHQTRSQIQTVLSVLQDSETGQQGFILTGNEAFLAPYQSAQKRIDVELKRLEARLSPQRNDEQLRQLAVVRQLSDRFFDFSNETIILRRGGQAMDAALLIAGGQGKAIMERIRGELTRMVASEERALAASTAEADAASRTTQIFASASLAFLALLLVGTTWVTWRTMEQRRRLFRQLRDTAARQRAILDSATDGILTLNPSGSIEMLNRAGQRMFGYDALSITRRDISLLFEIAKEGDEAASFLERLDLPMDGSTGTTREVTAFRSDGSSFPADVALGGMPLADGMHVVAIVRDITERKRIDQMKAEFISTVSHELRTPLTSIAGSLGLLAGGAGGALPEKAGKLISIAHANSQRLVRLINDILDIEKIESGQMPFDMKPVRLLPLINHTIQANRGFADGFKVRIELDPHSVDGTVLADADRLTQVVTNLLSNAVKFSPAGSAVEVSVRPHGRFYRITVRDHGPGIPESFQPRLFSKFAQADASDTRQKGGTGLGLSIAREITVRLGGTISFETAQNVGTAFHVDLLAQDRASEAPPTSEAGPRLLICEPNEATAQQFCTTLREAGFLCDVARRTDEAREHADRNQYAAVLVDLTLPGEGGISLIQRLRADPRYADTPIIVTSSDATAAESNISQVLTIVDWLHKPVQVDRLLAGLRDVLGRADGERAHILHVDDDPDVLRVVAAAFDKRAAVTSVPTLKAARDALTQDRFDLVILDLGLADGSGLDLLPDLRRPDGMPIPTVIFSAQDTNAKLAHDVDAVLTKSRVTLQKLVETVEAVVARSKARTASDAASSPTSNREPA